MSTRVVIDKDILGWANDQKSELSKIYNEIIEVGNDKRIPQRNRDDENAVFCVKENCDLMTGDKTAYSYFFDSDVKTVQIEKYAWDTNGDKPIYLIKIIK